MAAEVDSRSGVRGASRFGVVILALAVAAVAVLLGVLATRAPAAGEGETGLRIEDPSRPAAAPARALEGLGDGEGTRASGEAGTQERVVPAASRTFTVAALDARTGEPVRDFWVRRDSFAEVAAGVERRRSDPETAEVTLDRGDAPGPLSVRARGYAEVHAMAPGAPLERLVVELERTPSIEGVVRDGTSAPLAGVRVRLDAYGDGPEALSAETDPIAYTGSSLAKTDAEGRYVFTDLVPGVYATRAEVGGLEHASERVWVGRGAWETIDHWARMSVRIACEVRAPDGTAAERTLVLVLPADDDPKDEPRARGYTDATGRVTLGPLGRGAYRVLVVSDVGTADERSLEIDQASATLLDLLIELEPKD